MGGGVEVYCLSHMSQAKALSNAEPGLQRRKGVIRVVGPIARGNPSSPKPYIRFACTVSVVHGCVMSGAEDRWIAMEIHE